MGNLSTKQEQKELFKLDLKDRKILNELDSNARQSCSQIAKKVGLSTEVVNYRIKKLEEEKIITQYQTAINISKLGIIQFKLCLSLQHLTSDNLEKIISQLRLNKSIKWIVSCKGNWDLIISSETDSLQKVESLKNEVLSLFGNHIDQKSLSIAVEASAFSRNYLLEGKKSLNREKVIINYEEKIKIDDLDLEILGKLSENSRKSIINIASELRKTPKIIHYRIKQLIKSKVITGFRIVINYEKLGIHFYKVFVYLDKPEKSRVNELIRYFQGNKNIIHHVGVIGNWDFEPEFEVYSEDEFNNLLREMKDKFSDVIKKLDIVTVSKEHKFVYF